MSTFSQNFPEPGGGNGSETLKIKNIVVIICQGLFFFSPAPFYLITQIVQTVQGAGEFYCLIYLFV